MLNESLINKRIDEVPRSCSNCASFEERRDIDDAVLCEIQPGPFICCDDFQPKDRRMNDRGQHYNFCSECAFFETIHGDPICIKDHQPGVACEAFTNWQRRGEQELKAYFLLKTRSGTSKEIINTFRNKYEANFIQGSIVYGWYDTLIEVRIPNTLRMNEIRDYLKKNRHDIVYLEAAIEKTAKHSELT
jgi:hypothetical protein